MPKVKDYRKLPIESGCYLFRDSEGIVLYVGKAKNLRKRVANYFRKKNHDLHRLVSSPTGRFVGKIEMLVSHIDSIDYYVTATEVEALLLENNLIKRYYPRYNIDLKDSRRYAYLHLTTDSLPYIEVARTREAPGQYFGPFVSGRYRREIQKVLSRHFKILTSKPSALKKKTIVVDEYKRQLKKAVKLLNGDVRGLIKSLNSEMDEASEKTHFEHALALKNQIEALKYLKEKQNMELRRNYDADIINFVRLGDSAYLLLFNIYKGVLENKQEFEFKFSDTFFEEFLLQYYGNHPVPRELIIPKKIEKSLESYLVELRGKAVKVVVPERGPMKALLELALKNVQISLHSENERVYELQKVLNLAVLPELIECFDISHLRGTHTVASMVTFRDGKPQKSTYRKFRIKTVSDGDDFEAMREVIYRRYAKSLKETLPMPDLIVVDGGRGQLSAALKILKKLKLNINVISLAKKLEEIYIFGRKEPLKLNAKNKGLLLLRALRDEAHRFAINYNRKLRRKSFVKK